MSEKCQVCQRDPQRMNSEFAECSHVDCPNRRKAWSERPRPATKHPSPKKKDHLDDFFDTEGLGF